MKAIISLTLVLLTSISYGQNWLYPTKNSSAEEAGLAIRQGGSIQYYIYSDNGTNDFNIQSTGVSGEQDAYPRLRLPYASPNVLLGLSGGNVGIGNTSPGAKLSFSNLNDGRNLADGITWYNPSPLVYGIYRTAGAWSAPDYQQLKLSWDTGIILDPGTLYGKSYVDVQGSGLRVSSGFVGIGTANPLNPLHIRDGSDGEDQYSGLRFIPAKSAAQATYPGQNYHMISGFRRNGLWIAGSSNGSTYSRSNILLTDLGISIATSDDYSNPENNSRLMVLNDGNVGIGTTTPDSKLSVNGTIHSKEVKVDLTNWPDYVFDVDYDLKPLSEVKEYINKNHRLPEMPSAREVEENGVMLGEMNKLLLQKLEEVTLHLIRQQEEIDALKKALVEQN
ncbi:MAG: hypothetical protein RH860_08020 [Cytophagales bacterium]